MGPPTRYFISRRIPLPKLYCSADRRPRCRAPRLASRPSRTSLQTLPLCPQVAPLHPAARNGWTCAIPAAPSRRIWNARGGSGVANMSDDPAKRHDEDTALLRVVNLRKCYFRGGRWARRRSLVEPLRGIDLTIRSGTALALIG